MTAARKKRILVSCGSGFVTSTIVREQVERLLNDNGYANAYEIDQVSLASAPAASADYDFIVATAITPSELHCPYVNGVPYLMGGGIDASNAEILRLMALKGDAEADMEHGPTNR